MVKQTMIRKNPAFNESYYGYSTLLEAPRGGGQAEASSRSSATRRAARTSSPLARGRPRGVAADPAAPPRLLVAGLWTRSAWPRRSRGHPRPPRDHRGSRHGAGAGRRGGHHRGVLRLPVTLLQAGPAGAGPGVRRSSRTSVRLVYKDFPLDFHDRARPAAEAARCAGGQGRFWEYHDLLFLARPTFGRDAADRLRGAARARPRAVRRLPGRRPLQATRSSADMAEGQALGVTRHADLLHQREEAGRRPAGRGLPRGGAGRARRRGQEAVARGRA